jgi:hypothetical protein
MDSEVINFIPIAGSVPSVRVMSPLYTKINTCKITVGDQQLSSSKMSAIKEELIYS